MRDWEKWRNRRARRFSQSLSMLLLGCHLISILSSYFPKSSNITGLLLYLLRSSSSCLSVPVQRSLMFLKINSRRSFITGSSPLSHGSPRKWSHPSRRSTNDLTSAGRVGIFRASSHCRVAQSSPAEALPTSKLERTIMLMMSLFISYCPTKTNSVLSFIPGIEVHGVINADICHRRCQTAKQVEGMTDKMLLN